MLAQVCEKISADWYEIIPALRLDKRIGKQAYLKPGLGISGGNIERDVCSIQTILKKNQQPFSITKAFQENSQYKKSWVYRILKQEKIILKKDKYNIGILGLAYKENTNSIKNSPALHLLKKLKSNKVCVYDPIVKLNKKIKNCTQLNNIKSLITNSNVIVLMTPWPEFNKILQVIKLQKAKNITLIDPYRIVNFKIIKNKHFKYFTIGR